MHGRRGSRSACLLEFPARPVSRSRSHPVRLLSRAAESRHGQTPPRRRILRILFLGASALHRKYGEVEQALHEQLASAGHRNVRIFNVTTPGHTSRDSWLKYAALAEARFDLVIFYHGINDTTANNAPPEIFRGDYAHYSWYEVVNVLASYHRATSFALPYTLRYVFIRTRQTLAKDRYLPTGRPRNDWVHYGAEPRSALAFRQNLKAILDLAARRGDRVLLMTFATYVPTDYSEEAFHGRRLDYGLHRVPLEAWGRREHVVKAVAAHNEVVRTLASQHDNVLFVD